MKRISSSTWAFIQAFVWAPAMTLVAMVCFDCVATFSILDQAALFLLWGCVMCAPAIYAFWISPALESRERWQKAVKRFFSEWYMVPLPAAGMTAMIVAICTTGHSTTMTVPIEFCHAQYTGRTKTEDVPLQSCAAYDKNMMCTAPITTWSTQVRSETRITCDFVEWR